MDDLRLWKDEASGRWYCVPEGVTPREGTLVLRDVDGESRGFDPDEVAGWAISEDEAVARFRGRMEAVLVEGLGAFGEVVKTLGGKPLALDAPDGGADALQSALAGLFGVLAGELGDDPQRRAEADATLRRVVAQVGDAVGDRGPLEDAAESALAWLRKAGSHPQE